MITSIESEFCNYIVGENCESIKRNTLHDTETLTCFEVTIKSVVQYVLLIDFNVSRSKE